MMDADYETLVNELNIVRRKLESKVEALIILNERLCQCQNDRDHFKSLAEHSRTRCANFPYEGKGVNQLVLNMKDQNKALQIEVDTLRQKFTESQGDMKLLREQLSRQRLNSVDEGTTSKCHSQQEREELVRELETTKTKYSMLERDLQTVLDEKEELVSERDAYKHKVDRLNHQLNYVLKGDEKRIVDVDTLVMENRYLQERLKQIQEERSLYLQTLSKYKSVLEKRRNHGNLKLGANNGAVIISHRQVQNMLQCTNLSQLPTTQATIADLRSLAIALFEALSDKNTALTHQKKTNKILGNRVTELEKKVKHMEWTTEMPILQRFDVTDCDQETHSEQLDVDKVPLSPIGDNADVNLNKFIPFGAIENGIAVSRPSPPDLTVTELEPKAKLVNGDEAVTMIPIVEGDAEEEELPPELLRLVEEALENLDT